MQFVSKDLCNKDPSSYKYCGIDCISINASCPCEKDNQFRCFMGNCIAIESKCDGFPQCFFGEDEVCCPNQNISHVGITDAVTKDGKDVLSEPIAVALVFLSLLVIVFFIIIILLCVKQSPKTRHRLRHTGAECQKLTVMPVNKTTIKTENEMESKVFTNRTYFNKYGKTHNYPQDIKCYCNADM